MALIQGLDQDPYRNMIQGVESLSYNDSPFQGLERFRSSLMEACQSGDLALVRYILEKPYVYDILTTNSEPDVQKFKYFLLLDVIERGDRQIYELLLERGINPKDNKSDFIIRALSSCSRTQG